jgi:hypothetical protein
VLQQFARDVPTAATLQALAARPAVAAAAAVVDAPSDDIIVDASAALSAAAAASGSGVKALEPSPAAEAAHINLLKNLQAL